MSNDIGVAFAKLREDFPSIRRRLLAWFRKHGRDYPWRETDDWFHLLLAEMMLRRTRADQVVPVYRHFTSTYPTPRRAAKLGEDELETLMQPLGLRWRGRQMYQTIQYIRDAYLKRPPGPTDDLLEIPGVGDYSNAMLRNRLFHERVAPIDSNFVRFFYRLTGRSFQPDDRRKPELIELANAFVQSKHAADLNLAILDLAALVCRPAHPACPECPLMSDCVTGRTSF